MAFFGTSGRQLGTMLGLTLFFLNLSGAPVFAETSFFMERPRLGLGLSYESETDTMKGPHAAVMSNTRIMKERMDIETKGWGYHPTLMRYTVKLSPQWEQQREKTGPAEPRTRQTFLQGYDLDLTFLQYKPYSLNLFARKTSTTEKTAFAGRLITDLDLYGANLFLRYKTLPTTLSYSHSLSRATGFYTSREEKDYAQFITGHRESSNDTNLAASFTLTNRETPFLLQDTRSFNERLHNVWSITPDRRIMLNSSQTHRRFENDLTSLSGLGVTEYLVWKHRENLSSSYNLSYLQDRYDDFSSETKSAGAELSHVLYENLTSSLALDASRRDMGGGSEKTRGGSLGFDYRRVIPWGMLAISAGNGYSITNNEIERQFTPVLDEAHVLREGDIALLVNKLVDIGSLVVAKSDRTIIYTKDIDYRVDEVGTSVRVSRTIFGAIGDGQEVLISYRYLSNPAFDYATRSSSHGGSLFLWSTLRIYYRYAHSRQEFLSETSPGEPAANTTRVAGSDLTREWKWTTTRVTFEDAYSSSGISYDRWVAQEALKFIPSRSVSLGLSATAARTFFKDTGLTEKSYGISAYHQWMVSRWSNFRNDVFWNEQRARASDSGFSSLFEWYYGIWRGTITYRFIDTRDRISGQSRGNHAFLFTITRMMF